MVPIAAGVAGIMRGTAFVGDHGATNQDLQSHFAYLSGLLLGIGLAFVISVFAQRRSPGLFSALALIVIVGGVARLFTALRGGGLPSTAHQFALVMELVVVPLLLLWHRRLV